VVNPQPSTISREPTMRICRPTVILFLLEVAVVAGCGQSNSLSGKVTYNGEPVQSGSVRFDSSDGSGPGFGAEVADGKYSTDKVRLGKHRVYVRGLQDAPPMTREQQMDSRKSGNRYGLPVDYIPEDAEGNGQTVEITSGSNTLDFELKGPPRAG
jgi:hypothetical protein